MSANKLNELFLVCGAYNPIQILLDSVNKTKTGYKYKIDISNTCTGEYIRGLTIIPNTFNINYGSVDISRIVADYIEKTNTPLLLPFSYVGENTYQCKEITLNFGEEYLYEWNFYDNTFNFTPPYTSRVGFTGSTSNAFLVGDWINITQSGTPTHTEYNGVFQVVQKNGNDVFVDYPFISATAAEGGTIKYQDLRNIAYTGQNTTSMVAIDTCFEDFVSLGWMDKVNISGLTEFLTIIDNNDSAYKVRFESEGFLNIMLDKQYDNVSVVYTQGTDVNKISANGTTCATRMWRVPFAPKSINDALGYDFISASTYVINIEDNASEEILTETFAVNTTNECSPQGSWITMIFEDKMSSYIPISLRVLTKNNSTINRKNIKRNLENKLNTDNYYLPVTESQGYKTYNVDVDTEYTAHTGLIDEGNVKIIKGLLTSKNVYLLEGGGIVPVQILNKDFETKTAFKNQIIDYEISFKKQQYGEKNIW